MIIRAKGCAGRFCYVFLNAGCERKPGTDWLRGNGKCLVLWVCEMMAAERNVMTKQSGSLRTVCEEWNVERWP